MKKESIKSRMGKSLFVWTRSFLFTLVVISGVLILLMNWMIKSFSTEIMNLNHRITANIQTGIDIRLNDIDNFMAHLPLNSDNMYLSRAGRIEDVEVERMIQMYSRLNEYKMSNTFIKEIYIYYPKLDYVVGDLGYFSTKQYYMLAHEQKDSGYKQWLNAINSGEYNRYYFQKDSEDDLNLYYTKWLPYDDSEEKSAILQLSINKEEVEYILKNDKYMKKNSLNAIVGENGSLYAFGGSQDKKVWVEEVLQRSAGNSHVETEQYSGAMQESEFYPLSYITLYDRKEMFQNSYFVRNIAYLWLGLCMILGSVLFWILGRRNNRPLRNIIDKLYVREDRQGKDEYTLIQNRIDTIIESDQMSQKKLSEQKSVMESMFLYHLLSSEERNNIVIFAAMQRFQLQFEYSLFQVLVLRSKIGFSGEETKDIISKIKSQTQDRTKELYVIATEFKGDIVILLHMEEEAAIEQSIFMEAGAVQSSVRLFAGGIYDTMSNIILSYQQARMLMETAEKSGNQIIRFAEYNIVVDKEEKTESGIMVEYELDMLGENYESAKKQIDRLFNQYVNNDHHIFTARSKKYAIINSVIEALSRMTELDGTREKYITKLQNARDNQELLDVIHEVFRTLIDVQKKRQKSKKEGSIEQAKLYIEQHFEDPMIGLYSIAEALGISNTYLSTSFKKRYGLGIVQYINQLRIEKAKKMIVSTDYSIKEIAFRVGFTSDMTFIRVFKQFENMTPGKYKKDGFENKI